MKQKYRLVVGLHKVDENNAKYSLPDISREMDYDENTMPLMGELLIKQLSKDIEQKIALQGV